MPHQEAKLDEKQVALFIEKLRIQADQDPTIGKDIVEMVSASFSDDRKESSDEIAKTICEILEPERLGTIIWITCESCNAMLSTDEIESEMKTCFSCRMGIQGGGCC